MRSTRRKKLRLTPQDIHKMLGLPHDVQPFEVFITQDPPMVWVVLESERFEEQPPDCESPIVYTHKVVQRELVPNTLPKIPEEVRGVPSTLNLPEAMCDSMTFHHWHEHTVTPPSALGTNSSVRVRRVCPGRHVVEHVEYAWDHVYDPAPEDYGLSLSSVVERVERVEESMQDAWGRLPDADS